MRIFSIDVGIKNLSYAFIDIKSTENYNIIDWNNINILHSFDDLQYVANEYTKWPKPMLIDCIIYLNLDNNPRGSKSQLKNIIKSYLDKKCIKKKNSYDLEKIVENIKNHFNSNFKPIDCDLVLIENQPCMKNPQMKSMQIIIFSYFCFVNNSNYTVKFINANEKMKFCLRSGFINELPKKDYKATKKYSIDFVNKLLGNNVPTIWKNSKKKDDLSDVIIQAFAYCDKLT